MTKIIGFPAGYAPSVPLKLVIREDTPYRSPGVGLSPGHYEAMRAGDKWMVDGVEISVLMPRFNHPDAQAEGGVSVHISRTDTGRVVERIPYTPSEWVETAPGEFDLQRPVSMRRWLYTQDVVEVLEGTKEVAQSVTAATLDLSKERERVEQTIQASEQQVAQALADTAQQQANAEQAAATAMLAGMVDPRFVSTDATLPPAPPSEEATQAYREGRKIIGSYRPQTGQVQLLWYNPYYPRWDALYDAIPSMSSVQQAAANAARASRTILLDKYGSDDVALRGALAEAAKTGVQTIDASRGINLGSSVTIAQDVAIFGNAAPQWHELAELTGDSLLTTNVDMAALLHVRGRPYQPGWNTTIGTFELRRLKLQGRTRNGVTGTGAYDAVLNTAGGGPMSPIRYIDCHARGFRNVYAHVMPDGLFPPDSHPVERGTIRTTGSFNLEIGGGTYTYNRNMLYARGANAIGNVTISNVVNRAGGRVYTENGKVPVLDSNGNPVLDSNGNPKTAAFGSVYGSVSVSDMLSEGQTNPYTWALAFANLKMQRIYFEGNWEEDGSGNPLYKTLPDGTKEGVPGCVINATATNNYSVADISDLYLKHDGHYARFRNMVLHFDAERVDLRLKSTRVRKLRSRRVYADLAPADEWTFNTFGIEAIAHRMPPAAQAKGGAVAGYGILGSVQVWTPFGTMAGSHSDPGGYSRLTFGAAAGDVLEINCLAWSADGQAAFASPVLVDINSGAPIIDVGADIFLPAGEMVMVSIAVPIKEAHDGFLFRLSTNAIFTNPWATARPATNPLTLWVPRA
ncbi:hypothetical protein ACINK0_11365 [Deinococcus sp. VB343]|uniref:hypothetical protein n=1 Tax=Deinococcus sp. VB343 TaxID=3385567 RepID=UPI0039C99D87